MKIGRPDESQDGFAAAWPGPLGHWSLVKRAMEKLAILRNLMIKYTEGESTHDNLLKRARGENTWYKRLNVSDGLQGMKLDYWERGEWRDGDGAVNVVPGGKTLSRMEEVTRVYLERGVWSEVDGYARPAVKVRQCAEKLVRQRRAREGAAVREGGEAREKWRVFVGEMLGEGGMVRAGTGKTLDE